MHAVFLNTPRRVLYNAHAGTGFVSGGYVQARWAIYRPRRAAIAIKVPHGRYAFPLRVA